jgi:hypothetical protein
LQVGVPVNVTYWSKGGFVFAARTGFTAGKMLIDSTG